MKEGAPQLNKEPTQEKSFSSEKKEAVKVLELKTKDGKTIQLECSSYDFEYPESIQKETGILGYERTLISNEEIEKYFNQDISSIEILNALSEGRYPSESFTYQIGAWDSPNTEDYSKQFKSDKFILQDIFGVSSYFDLKNKGTKGVFNRGDRDTPDNSLFDVFDKETNKIIGYSGINTIFNKYIDKIKNNEVFIVSGNGLNVGELDFFCGTDISNKNNITFGFDRQDSLFQDYISKSIDSLRNLNNINKIEPINSHKENDLNAGYQPRLYPNGLFFEFFGLRESENSKSHLIPHNYTGTGFRSSTIEKNGESSINIKKRLSEKYGSAFSNNVDDMNKTTDPNYRNTYYGWGGEDCSVLSYKNIYLFDIKKLHKDSSNSFDSNNNPHDLIRTGQATYHLPIFINNNDVKQLKWGHANYATFWTEKGFNYLKIKHADKFPEDPLEEAK